MPTFPVNREALDRYPNINSALGRSRTQGPRAEGQIFRLLYNDNAGQRVILEFVERLLDEHQEFQDFIVQKIRTRDLLQFRHGLHELYLLARLLRSGHEIVTFDDAANGERVPEFAVQSREGMSALVELYTPHDFLGYEILKEEIMMELTYMEEPIGFDVRIIITNSAPPESSDHWTTPYQVRELFRAGPSRRELALGVRNAVASLLIESESSAEIPISQDLMLRITGKRKEDPEWRFAALHSPTHSVGTELYIDLAPCDAPGLYRSLRSKVGRDQLRHPDYPGALKVLVLNLEGLMDGESFLSIPQGYYQSRFYERMQECLSINLDPEKVDVVIPVVANVGEHFEVGDPVFNPSATSASWLLG